MDYKQLLYYSLKAQKVHLKKVRRKRQLKRRNSSKNQLTKNSVSSYEPKLKRKYRGYRSFVKAIPNYPEVILFLIPKYKSFSNRPLLSNEDGNLSVPETFSISENQDESMFFLKRLFHCLYTQNQTEIFIDYAKCNYLDVDASACMDIILEGFIKYYEKCISNRIKVNIHRIVPKNFEKREISNVLFSIGAYKNLKKTKIKRPADDSFLPFILRIGDNLNNKKGTVKEIHETQIVDYVIACVKASGQELAFEAEKNLSKVVGEVMANAEEHSNFRYRYAIGYFVKPQEINNHLGIFKLSIFNFGQTIYESFSKLERQHLDVVKNMKQLSVKYTENKWFTKAKYEEETLWTLYSLQEGVTSLPDWQRGKGTIRFIDRFFKLKGDDLYDNNSKLTLISGNTKIIFDGKYPLKEVINSIDKKPYKMMTFNDSGQISELPDEKYVTFVPQTFPGTLITAKICLTNKNLSNE